MNQSTLGSRIKSHRKRLGLTQEQLAERMGVSAQAVSKWENDLSCPDISVLPDLAAVFGISVDELLGSTTTGQTTVHEAEVTEDKTKPERTVHFEFDKSGGVWLAVYILMVGGLLLLNHLMDLDVSWWTPVWTCSLIVFGIPELFRRFSLFHLAVSLTGAYFLLDAYGLFPSTPKIGWSILVPVFLLLWGVTLLVDALRGKHRRSARSGDFTPNKSKYDYSCGDGYLHCDVSFGSRRVPVTTALLRGGDIDSSFGDFTVDLSGCEAIVEDCLLKIDHNFGNLKLLVPERFDVQIIDEDKFAADVKRNGQPATVTQGTIRVKAELHFGAIEICFV